MRHGFLAPAVESSPVDHEQQRDSSYYGHPPLTQRHIEWRSKIERTSNERFTRSLNLVKQRIGFDELPDRARAYLKFLEENAGVEVGGISTGPEPNETIIRAGSKLERLMG